MKLKELTKTQRSYVFNNFLINDFHKSEVKPLDLLERLIENGHYKCYGFYEDDELVGYAYFIKSKDSILMDYLAVNSKYRCRGFGSRFIELIEEKFKGEYSSLLAEVENPKYSLDEDDKSNRQRRIDFYIKNGFKLSCVETCVYKDQYTMINLKLDKHLDDEEIVKETTHIYKTIFGEDIFERHIRVWTCQD